MQIGVNGILSLKISFYNSFHIKCIFLKLNLTDEKPVNLKYRQVSKMMSRLAHFPSFLFIHC